jgi:hypothetical protein
MVPGDRASGGGCRFEWKADFEPWEQILDGELDGRRTKRVVIKIVGG